MGSPEDGNNGIRVGVGTCALTSPDGSSVGLTSPGRVRSGNEDSFGLIPSRGLFVIADGMGGHNAGDVASEQAVRFLINHFDRTRIDSMRQRPESIEEELVTSVILSHEHIRELSSTKEEYEGMGTTLLLALVHGAHLHTCHVGDSRAYLVNRGGIAQLTYDHSMVGDLMRYGMMSTDEARKSPHRGQINQAAGAPFSIEPEYVRHNMAGSDVVLLCSDGLWEMLSDADIHSTVMSEATLAQAGTELVRKANQQGGKDNITVVLHCPAGTHF